MLRILPPLLIVSIIWFATFPISGVTNYFTDVSTLSFFINGLLTEWFFALLLVLYAVYPLVYFFIKKFQGVAAAILIILVVISNIVLYVWCPSIFARLEIATTRIPVFICGAWLAGKIKQQRSIPFWAVILSGVVGAALLVTIYYFPNSWGHYTIIRYAYCPLCISVVIVLSAILTRVDWKGLAIVTAWIGSYSMEIYLLFEKVLERADFIKASDSRNVIYTLVCAVVALIGAMLLKLIYTQAIHEMQKIRDARKRASEKSHLEHSESV